MINPFRNTSVGIHLLSSATTYPSAKVKRFPHRPKGFFHRLMQWSRPEATGYRDSTVNSVRLVERKANLAILASQEGALLKRGHSLLQQGDLVGAIEQYQQAIAHAPTSEAYQYLAEALSQQGQLEAAAFYYRQAIALLEDLDTTVAAESPPDAADSDVAHESSHTDASAVSHQQNSSRADSSKSRQTREIHWYERVTFDLQQAIVNCNSGDWQEATTACHSSLKRLEPEAATAYLILGRSLQAQGNLTEAEQAYCKSLALQASAEVHARLGSLYADQQRFAEAARHYQTAIQLEPAFAGAYWKLAAVWQQLNQEAEAVSCLYQTFQLQPDWADAADFCGLADRLLALKNLAQAEKCYDRALQLDSALAAAHWGLGAVQQQQGCHQTAIEHYRQAMRQTSVDFDLAAKLATALAELHQWQDALVCYQQWHQLSPCLTALVGMRTCTMQLERWSEACAVSEKLTQLEPNRADHWHHLGDVQRQLNQWLEAVAAYQQAIERNPNFSWSYNNLGDALLQLEQWSDAAMAFQSAIRLHPEFAWSHYNLGEALVQLQDWDNAIACYRTALKLQPDLPYASQKLADVLRHRAALDREDALVFYQQEIQQNPTDPTPYYKALELQPDAIELYLGLADALMASDRWDEAIICCQIGRQLEPENTELIAKLKYILQQRELARQPQINRNDYEAWIAQHTPTAADLERMAIEATTLTYQPLISIIMPVYNTPADFLNAAIESILAQVYANWELCIADDASADLEILERLHQFALRDSRIKVTFRSENGHIAAASNSALSTATGEFIVLFDHDDTLAPEALYEVVALLNQHPEADMIYSDEDKLDPQGRRVQPFFKPDWCPDSFLSRMYTCHLGVYRRQLVENMGGFRTGYEGSQDYDLVLRLTEKTDRIFHIPKVLYHWRIHTDSTAKSQTLKPYAIEAAKLALTEACQRRGEPVREVVTNPDLPGVYIPRYQIAEYQPVSIIIPTRNLGTTLDRCLQSIFQKTTYPNYEVILIDNGSNETEALRVIEQWQKREFGRFTSYPLDIPFNYPKLNNYGASKARGDYLLFLNNDVEVITPDWIEAMVEQAQRPSIGAVGALLLYPDQSVQHAGVVLGIGGIAGHSHKYYAVGDRGYFSQIVSVNNYSAVTAACLMCRRAIFDQVGGFDASLAVAFNDVDLCLKIQQSGYRNVSLPHAVLNHYESKSRGPENTLEKQQRFNQELRLMQSRWRELIDRDPCYSPHLTLEREDYGLRI